MAFTNAWDETFPADTQLAKLGAQDMRTIQTNTRERIAAFASGLEAARPTPEAVFAGVTYLATDTNKLFQWSGAVWNDITSVVAAMVTGSSPDGASLTIAGNPSLNNNTETFLSWDTTLYDHGPMFVAPWVPQSLLVAHSGIYQIDASVAFIANATGGRAVKILKNGATILGFAGALSAGATQFSGVSLSVLAALNAGDHFGVVAWQQSGGPLAVNGAQTFFSAQKVRDL